MPPSRGQGCSRRSSTDSLNRRISAARAATSSAGHAAVTRAADSLRRFVEDAAALMRMKGARTVLGRRGAR